MKIKILIIIFFLTFNVNATEINKFDKNTYEYEDQMNGLTNNDFFLQSEVETHCRALRMFAGFCDDIDFDESLDDIIKIRIQAELALEEESIKIKDRNIKSIMERYHKIYNYTNRKYVNLLKKNNLGISYLEKYLDDSFLTEALHDKMFIPKISVTKNDIYNYTKNSTYQNLYNTQLYTTLILEIPENLNHIYFIKALIKELKNKNEIPFQKFILNNKIIKTFLTEMDPNQNSPIGEILKIHVNEKIIGPVIHVKGKNKFTYVIKIVRVYDKLNDEEINLKVNHCLIKKNIKKNSYFFFQKKNKAVKELKSIKTRLLKDKKVNKKICKEIWIDSNQITNKYIFDNVVNLEKNEVSKILEDQYGWHLIKILEKNIDSFAEISKGISSSIKTLQYQNLKRLYLKYAKKVSYYSMNFE